MLPLLVPGEQPRHCLPRSHFWGLGEGCALAQCPPQPHSTGASHGGLGSMGAPCWGVGGLQAPVVGKPQRRPHSPRWAGVQPPPSGCAAQCACGALSLRQGFHSCQSLACSFSYSLWFLKFTDLLLVSCVSNCHPFPNPVSRPAVGICTPLKFPKQNGNGKSSV